MCFLLVGWGADQAQNFGNGPTMKSQILNIIRSVRTVMRSKQQIAIFRNFNLISLFSFTVPLIAINAVVILMKLVVG